MNSARPAQLPEPRRAALASLRAGAAILLVPLATVAAYWRVFRAGYIWDDDYYVYGNAALRSLDGLKRIWFELGTVPQYYPLTHSTFWLEYHLWGYSPLGFHVDNVLLHALNALLLWAALRALKLRGAWIAAALFALHPVHVESVAWITERKNVLSGACYLAALWSYLRFALRPSGDEVVFDEAPPARDVRGAGRFYFLSLAFFVAALLSKTVTLSLPAVIALLIWWKNGRVPARHWALLAPMAAIGAGMGRVTMWMERTFVRVGGEEWNYSFAERVLIAGRALCFYVGKLLWPAKLTFIYPRWHVDAAAAAQWLFPLAVAAAAVALFTARKRLGRGPLVAWLVFAGTLTPALGFFDTYPMRYSLVADHFQYLASAALLAAAGWTAAGLLAGRARAVIAVVLAVLAILVWRRLPAYAGEEALWTDTIAKNPSCWMAYVNMGRLYEDAGQLDRAEGQFRKALEIHPGNPEARVDLGNVLQRTGRPAEAIEHYRVALKMKPDLPEAFNNWGKAAEALNDPRLAYWLYRQALRIRPTFARALTNRANLQAAAGLWADALQNYQRAVASEPENVDALNNCGNALLNFGRTNEAAAMFKKAIALKPNFVEAHYNLGNVSLSLQRWADAEEHYRAALAINPAYAPALTNLGNAMASQGRISEAAKSFQQSIRAGPGDPAPYRNLGDLLHGGGMLDDAAAAYTDALRLAPGDADTRNKLGVTLAKLGRKADAAAEFREALRLRPGFDQARENLASLGKKKR